MSNIPSPDSYIDWGFYSLISAGLQRRVWLSSGHMAIYPNMFVFLVGKPAIGKGNVINAVRGILTDHVLEKERRDDTTGLIVPGRYRFPLAADCTTFESLIQEMALCTSIDKEHMYAHCSLTFMLDEIHSLLNDETDKLEIFLRTAWTCRDYDRKTKNKGHFLLRNIWLNILGGITPDEMTKIVRLGITGTGLASRTVMVYADQNRFKRFFIDEPTDDQYHSRALVSAHISKLGNLYGKIETPDNVQKYCEELIHDNTRYVASKHPLLEHYYGRKSLHIIKLAICLMMADEARVRPITIEYIDQALEILNQQEPTMPEAIDVGGKNHMSTIAIRIIRALRERREASLHELQAICFDDATPKETEETVEYMLKHGKITNVPKRSTHYMLPQRV